MHPAFSVQSPQTRPDWGREWGWSVTHGQMGILEGRVFPKAACRGERSSAPTAACGPQVDKSPSHELGGEVAGRGLVCRQGDGPAAGGDDGLLLAASQPLRPEHLRRSQPSGLPGQQELHMLIGLTLGCSRLGAVTNHFSEAQLLSAHSFPKN